uniref:3-oxoacyl-(Acyl-carrier-protein) synthase n=1 Tax=Candidatus Kentrum sp. FM TaxID=2126340 RepID=A0A450VQK1_9GAMM|nr:MAG: 3-oxoacyl-(acyl-carrier-protein) synthase [Candidatus Kentron sp. FM]VFJ46015.1 MAG: 3-oxoacyl-(acyl-carrier-protein) synthase [Candidatus Kentron sp. FM]VFK07035.1 MAG: 3-oxoacyl-(acyl-carrier-protein) synthase [Candidatus Kentron sp. FM]
MKPIAITGLGAVSPFGYGINALWHGMEAGPAPLSPIPEAEYKHSPGLYGPAPFHTLPRGNALIARANTFARIGYWAAHDALRDARYRVGDGYRCALISGSTIGYSVVSQFGDMLDMGRSQYLYHSAVNGVISIRERVRGMQIMLYSQESVSTQGIGLASQLIAGGKYQAALVGGVEIYSRALHACYSSVRKISPLDTAGIQTGEPALRPWHPNRNGFIFSEGACYLLLEDLQMARDRGAHIYGLITGWGTCQEQAYDNYEIDESGKGLSDSIDQALGRAGVGIDQVDVVIASANGSVKKDIVEFQCLGGKFTDIGTAPVTITGYKQLLGETLGAGGAFSTALACLSITHGALLPTIDAGIPTPDSIEFSNGDKLIGTNLLITDLGYHGDSAALLLRRNQ